MRRRARRPGRNRDAQLPRVGHLLLGDRVDRRGGRRHERMVDEQRDGVRPRRFAPEGVDRRRRAAGACAPGSRRPPGSCSAAPRRCAFGPRAARRRGALDRCGGARRSARGAARRRHRSRRRRLHLLHIGYDRIPEGRAADPSWFDPQHPQHRLHDDSDGDGRGQGCRGRRRSCASTQRRRGAGTTRADGADSPLPCHRVQLHHASGNAHRRHRRVHAQVGRRACARTDRARAGHQLLGCADDEPRTARPSGLGDARHQFARRNDRRRGSRAARPRRQDRQGVEERRAGTGYGLTETHGIVTANGARLYLAKPDSAGPIVPTLDAKLVDDEGNDLEPGADVVGPTVRARRRS